MCECNLIYSAKLVLTPVTGIRIAMDNNNPKKFSFEMPSLGPSQVALGTQGQIKQ